MKYSVFLLLFLPLFFACSASDQTSETSRSGSSSLYLNYEMREDWIIEYYQFHNVSFRNPNAPFGYALYIFPDNLYYVVILRNTQDLRSRPYDKRLLTRSYITPIEMRRTEIHFERAEFGKLPAVLPIDERDQEQCRKVGPTIRMGLKLNDKPYISRTTNYTGCDSEVFPDEFYRLKTYMTDLFAQLRVRQNVHPDANIEDALAEIEAAIDTTIFMQPANRFPDPDELEDELPGEVDDEETRQEQTESEEPREESEAEAEESQEPKEESEEEEEEEEDPDNSP